MANRSAWTDPDAFRRAFEAVGPGGGLTRLTPVEDFGPNPGRLAMAVHIPAGSADRPLALVVVLHGCLQDAGGYDRGSGWSALADELGFVVVYAEQQARNNPNRCFNWFSRGHTSRGLGEVASIRQMIEHAAALATIDRTRIFVTGLSAGGAMAAAMLATYPEVFAAGAIVAGLPFRAATTLRGAVDVMRNGSGRTAEDLATAVRGASQHGGTWPRVAVWHGDRDGTVARQNADEVVEQWRLLHGLPHAPSERSDNGAVRRQVWRDGSGRVVLEDLRIAGLGHGAPVVPAQLAGVPGGAPFFLAAPVSSTHDIARFFGLEVRPASEMPPARVSSGDLMTRVRGYLRRIFAGFVGRP